MVHRDRKKGMGSVCTASEEPPGSSQITQTQEQWEVRCTLVLTPELTS